MIMVVVVVVPVVVVVVVVVVVGAVVVDRQSLHSSESAEFNRILGELIVHHKYSCDVISHIVY